MGILTTYAIYKYGKNKAEKRQQLTNEQLEIVCDNCGYKLRQHSDDGNLSCPSF
jgi:DNA-directed RNA polymerase subunit RPC12/RpoP